MSQSSTAIIILDKIRHLSRHGRNPMRQSRERKPVGAFTLVELLVVIAVIALLAAILLPVLSRAKAKALQTQCLSNFKQTGIALQMFVDEHNDQLPPGGTNSLLLTERPTYAKAPNFRRLLAYNLATYLSLPSPDQLSDTITNTVKTLLCPAYVQSLPGNTLDNYDGESDNFQHAYCFAMSRNLGVWFTNTPLAALQVFPFGWQATGQPSLRLADIAHSMSLSDAWAAADFDQDAVVDPATLGDGVQEYVALKPPHRTARNFLFFDMHAAAKKVTSWEDY
jgi:prepilin-type N-terminal cleavage/methylation domain-containing protein